MGLSLGKESASSPWPDLPPELAAEILSRLLCHTDRASFGAVCRGWRLAVRQQISLLPSAMPWINLGGGAYQDLGGNGKAQRFAAPRGYRACATFGSWVLYEHKYSFRCFLGDPLSPSTPAIEVPCRYHRIGAIRLESLLFGCCEPFKSWHLRKMVVCSPHLVVAMPSCDGPPKIACFRPSNETATQPVTLSWSNAVYTNAHQHHGLVSIYKDVAFHHGKVFVLGSMQNLYAYDLIVREMPLSQTLSRLEHAIMEGPAAAARAAVDYPYHHLVTSSDKQKLLMVRWRVSLEADWTKVNHRSMDLQVFEADLQKGRWSEVKDLGGQALFVGRTGSRALATGGLSDRVFILGDEWSSAWFHATRTSYCKCFDCQKLGYVIPSYAVYDMMSGEATLVFLRGGHRQIESLKMAWFFPSESHLTCSLGTSLVPKIWQWLTVVVFVASVIFSFCLWLPLVS